MAPDKSDSTHHGVALLCDQDGRIVKVLSSTLSGVDRLVGKSFPMLLHEKYMQRGFEFLMAIKKHHAIWGWDLALDIKGQALKLIFAGGNYGDNIIIIAADNDAEFNSFYKELTLISNEQANQLRTLCKQQAQSRQRNDDVYDEMTRLNNELSNLQRDLAKKNVQLAKLNEQKNELLGVAAHDLRNPLGVIMGYAKFLLHDAENKNFSETDLEFMRQIEQSSQFMLRLLEDLLDISHIESGKLNIDLKATDLLQLISDNVRLNRVIAQRKNIDIGLEMPDSLPTMQVDTNKIEQVLNNLLSNAIKYSHANTNIRVVVEKDAQWVSVAVHDQGQGIPEDEQARLFEAFARTSVRGTAGEKSTGLGLSITRKLIHGHGGEIWVKSTPGEGSSFCFRLPIDSANNA